jgi:hypothetical protein
LRLNLITERWRPDEVIEKASVELGFVDDKQKVMATDNGSVKIVRYDAEATDLGVDFGNEKLTGLANLLSLRRTRSG